MIRRHDMPFGAAFGPDGTRFRLWAPSVDAVYLCLDTGTGERTLPMAPAGGGWFEIAAADAGPGARYRFRLPDGLMVPDPASRTQPDDVHGASQVVDPAAFAWQDADWRGRPWPETVLYELHVGAFTAEGTFRAVIPHLAELADLGVTAIELMPIADFPGRRNWGYDGVDIFAPDASYGTPDDLKTLVQAAHATGLMVFLDVVYNHFGPDGNYLGIYAAPFFTRRHHTPWGSAIGYGGPDSRVVRDFFVENALYWLEEYHLDGLRLDAVEAIHDPSDPHILTELAEAVRARLPAERHVHLVLENDRNQARRLRGAGTPESLFDGQWNDDFHHVIHHLLTGETDGYYADYADAPASRLARVLSEGFSYQGEPSGFRGGRARGEPTKGLPPSAFVVYLQNHDQVGNRAFGQRIGALAPAEAVDAAAALCLLAPSVPLMFMGEEWDADARFPFFCDFGPDLAKSVRDGRRAEFARFAAFADPAARERIPDPNADVTFAAAVLDRAPADSGRHAARRALYKELLALRARHVVPLLRDRVAPEAEARVLGPAALAVRWRFAGSATLSCLVNLGGEDATFEAERPGGRLLYASHLHTTATAAGITGLPAWFVAWYLEDA